MGGFSMGDDGILTEASEFIFGDPKKPIEEATARSAGYTQESMRLQKEMFDKSLAAYQEQMRNALAAQTQGQQQSLGATLLGQQQGVASQLAGSQVGADLLRYATAQQQAQQMPTQIARLGALQALPQLQQFIGTQAYAVPNRIETTAMPEVNYLNAYNQALAATTPQYEQMATRLGLGTSPVEKDYANLAGLAYNPAATGAGPALPTNIRASAAGVNNIPSGSIRVPVQTVQPTVTTTASMPSGSIRTPATSTRTPTVTNVDLSGMPSPTTPSPKTYENLQGYAGPAYAYQESPIYKLQQEQTTRNIDRALAARGLRGGAAGAAVQGQAARELSATEAEKAYSRLMDQVQIGLGYSPSSASAAGATQLASGYSDLGSSLGTSLGNLGSQASGILGQGAAQRAGLYQNYGQGLASAYSGLGAGQAQGLMSLAQQQNAAANAIASQPSAASQLINLGLTAYGAGMFGGGGMGGGAISAAPSYGIPAGMMTQFTNPYIF